MLLCPNTTIYIGPPGCGKTTTLLNKVEGLIESGVPPENIGYVSFTRQAIHEAITRIIKRTGLNRDQFRNFRTLHSMAFYLLGNKLTDMLTEKDMAKAGNPAAEFETFSHMYQYHRVTGMSLEDVWDMHYSPSIYATRYDFLQWVETYEAFKHASKKSDFTDLLDDVARRKPYFPFDWLFVDEAQDLTPSQWRMVQVLAANADNLVVAGDPDQTIFAWSGADSGMLESLEGERKILSQSYRIPRKVHVIAERILKATKRDILYRPTPQEGELHWCSSEEPYHLDYDNNESWYILSRNTYYLQNIAAKLYSTGIWYSYLGEGHNQQTNKAFTRLVDRYTAYCRGELKNEAYFAKECQEHSTDIAEAKKRGLAWWEAFDLWPIDRIEYLKATVGDWDSRRVRLGTFHSSKGGEADNVVLLGETTETIHQRLQAGDIAELRAIYVAATRAKKRLFLVSSSRRSEIPWHHFINCPQDLISKLL